MWWKMISEIHQNNDSIKVADLWHSDNNLRLNIICSLKILSQPTLVLPANIGFVKRFSNSELQIFLFLYADFSLF